jgi:SNF2 family DNA or RNA helicase
VALFEADALEELQEVLLDCNPQQNDNRYRIHQNQAGFLNATLEEHQEWKLNAPPAWAQKTLANAEDSSLPSLGQLDAILRPYQKKGTAWLYFLRQHGFCGILADEMGLGKTVQVLALLAALKNKNSLSQPPNIPSTSLPCPALVVCPTSLVYNWVAEAAKFTPNMRVLEMHGPDRHKHFAEFAQYDVVVTSYALMRRDAEQYQNQEFNTLVLDEAQHIKNRQTQNAQAVKSIRAAHRMVLTGTPIENSVLDIWSIFDFLMPGYLGAAKDFRERYEVPIVREKSEEAQARLARRLRPFILRRLKREVAQDLPPKIDQVMYCELTSEQAEVYHQVLESSRQEVLNAVDAQGLAKSRMIILTALLRLRQVCCDLRLLNLENINPETASAKLDLFAELLEETIDGGHRALVFSQFTSMLALIQERLKQEGIPCCYLDGSTRDRAEVVNRFQEDSSIPVFLISLKAGGLGLNLTAADTVIHYDPWWNPAVEDQATDRAHRIGQTQVVTSYKLISRGTVEEKILQLQNRKREMIQGALGAEGELSDILNWEELQDLFR